MAVIQSEGTHGTWAEVDQASGAEPQADRRESLLVGGLEEGEHHPWAVEACRDQAAAGRSAAVPEEEARTDRTMRRGMRPPTLALGGAD